MPIVSDFLMLVSKSEDENRDYWMCNSSAIKTVDICPQRAAEFFQLQAENHHNQT